MRRKLTEPHREIDKSTLMVGHVRVPLSGVERSSRQKIRKDTDLKCAINQRDLTGIYRIPHPTTAEYPFFAGPQGPFTKTDHCPNHKTCLNKFTRIGTHKIYPEITLELN